MFSRMWERRGSQSFRCGDFANPWAGFLFLWLLLFWTLVVSLIHVGPEFLGVWIPLIVWVPLGLTILYLVWFRPLVVLGSDEMVVRNTFRTHRFRYDDCGLTFHLVRCQYSLRGRGFKVDCPEGRDGWSDDDYATKSGVWVDSAGGGSVRVRGLYGRGRPRPICDETRELLFAELRRRFLDAVFIEVDVTGKWQLLTRITYR